MNKKQNAHSNITRLKSRNSEFPSELPKANPKNNIAGKHFVPPTDQIDEVNKTYVPILRVEIPYNPTAKGLIERMLHQLVDHKYSRGPVSTKFVRLQALMKKAGIKTIMVDNLQRLHDQNSLMRTYDLGELLRILAEATGVTLVATDLPQCKALLAENMGLVLKLLDKGIQHARD